MQSLLSDGGTLLQTHPILYQAQNRDIPSRSRMVRSTQSSEVQNTLSFRNGTEAQTQQLAELLHST